MIALLVATVISLGCAGTTRPNGSTREKAPACLGNISSDTTTFEGRALDSPPLVRRVALVPYPPGLAATGRQQVVVRFRVLASGAVDSASIVVVSSTEPRLNRYAIEGVQKMEMWPACKDGAAVASHVQQTRSFGRGEG